MYRSGAVSKDSGARRLQLKEGGRLDSSREERGGGLGGMRRNRVRQKQKRRRVPPVLRKKKRARGGGETGEDAWLKYQKIKMDRFDARGETGARGLGGGVERSEG